MIRAFLAIVLGEAILERYAACHARESRQRRDFRWVRPGNVHITVRFLGDTREDRVEPLRREIESVTAGAAPFRIALGQPGCFGPRDRPQVLWFAIDEGASELKALVARIEDVLRRLKFAPDDKPWRAHITVARNPRRAPFRDWEEALKGWGLAGMGFEATEVTLLSSVLGPQGPTYSVLWRVALGGGAERAGTQGEQADGQPERGGGYGEQLAGGRGTGTQGGQAGAGADQPDRGGGETTAGQVADRQGADNQGADRQAADSTQVACREPTDGGRGAELRGQEAIRQVRGGEQTTQDPIH